MTDKIADLIIRIKNAYLAKQVEVVLPATKLLEQIAQLLVEEGYLLNVERLEKSPQDQLKLTLRYVNNLPSVTNVKRVSKPGRRVYAKSGKLPRILSGYGTAIVSTSKGVMTTKQAKQEQIGGEVLFLIW